MTYQPKVYRKQGGDEIVVADGGQQTVESGGEIEIESGGKIQIESGGEIDIESGGKFEIAGVGVSVTVTMAAASAAANVCEVTITVVDAAGTVVAAVHHLDVWLSDAETGAGLTGTTASGTVTAKTSSGAVIQTYTAKKALRVQTLATGIFILEITDSAKTAFYPCAALFGGKTFIGTVLASDDYGS